MKYLTRDLTLKYDPALCIGCGLCATVCPHGVFEMAGRKARLVDRDACMECGACFMNCPVDAVTVKSGVGCAEAMINGLLTGKETCCGGEGGCCAAPGGEEAKEAKE